MTDEQLLRAFEAGDKPAGGFHHEQHVRVAWLYVRRHPLEEALGLFIDALRRFAVAQGAPDLYHETITRAFVLLIAERAAADNESMSWSEFARRHPDLLVWKPSILDRYYRVETLASDEARRTFVAPDREPHQGLQRHADAMAGRARVSEV